MKALSLYLQIAYKILRLYLLFSLYSSYALGSETFTLGVLGADSNQRYTYDWITRKFEKSHPGVKIKTVAYSDGQFKEQLDNWFTSQSGPDVVTWQGGERLFQFARKGLITPLDDFWKENELDYQYDVNAINAVSHKNRKYGVPLSYYNWGFYYRKSLFQKYALRAPKTWQELLEVCETLNNSGILPITIGTKTPWTASAWFSYITLRLYGIEYYRSLINGELPFTDEKAMKIFELWKVMLDANYFPDDHQQYEWNETMPSLFRKISGMTLVGSFFTAGLPDSLRDDIGYFNFPTINPETPRYELAPLDLLMIPSYSQKVKLAEKFLLFMTREDIQSELNEKFKMLPTNVNAHIRGDYFTKVALTSLITAKGSTRFFDRDTQAKTHNVVLPLFVEFMRHKDVKKITALLEKLRLEGLFKHE
jgi:multiple sugar transport system substrate-binding protein